MAIDMVSSGRVVYVAIILYQVIHTPQLRRPSCRKSASKPQV
jgi:hypothetical protein